MFISLCGKSSPILPCIGVEYHTYMVGLLFGFPHKHVFLPVINGCTFSIIQFTRCKHRIQSRSMPRIWHIWNRKFFFMLFPLVALQNPWNASKFGITAKKCPVFVGFCWVCSCFPTFFGGPIAYLPISATFQGTCSPLGLASSIPDFLDSGCIWRGSLGNVASIPAVLWWIYCRSSHVKSMLQFGKSDIIPTLNH